MGDQCVDIISSETFYSHSVWSEQLCVPKGTGLSILTSMPLSSWPPSPPHILKLKQAIYHDFCLLKWVLTSTILWTCLLMVFGSGLGDTPEAQSTTTGGFEGVSG